jgi:hypothetical protein
MGALCCSCLCPENSDRGVEMSNNSNRVRILADAKLKGDAIKIENGTRITGNGSTFCDLLLVNNHTHTHTHNQSRLHLCVSNKMQLILK